MLLVMVVVIDSARVWLTVLNAHRRSRTAQYVAVR
jgi:hypothetical protein